MLGALVGHGVARSGARLLGDQLLERALRVDPGASAQLGIDPTGEQREHHGSGRVESAIDVHGADHRLHRVGEDGCLLPAPGAVLPLAEQQRGADADLGRHLGQRRFAHDSSPDAGQRALGQIGMGAEDVVGDHEAQHGVAEELQSLVGRRTGVLGAPGPMGEGESHQPGIGEAVTQTVEQGGEGVGGQRVSPPWPARSRPRRARS